MVYSGSQEGINLFTTQIYIYLLKKVKIYEGTVRQQLLEKIKTECSGLFNAIVQLRKEFNILYENFGNQDTFTSKINMALEGSATMIRNLVEQVK